MQGLQDVQAQEVEVNGTTYVVRTGYYVPERWVWVSPGFHDPEGVFSTRDAALSEAVAEIRARTSIK